MSPCTVSDFTVVIFLPYCLSVSKKAINEFSVKIFWANGLRSNSEHVEMF